jgi:hypothetical protein
VEAVRPGPGGPASQPGSAVEPRGSLRAPARAARRGALRGARSTRVSGRATPQTRAELFRSRRRAGPARGESRAPPSRVHPPVAGRVARRPAAQTLDRLPAPPVPPRPVRAQETGQGEPRPSRRVVRSAPPRRLPNEAGFRPRGPGDRPAGASALRRSSAAFAIRAPRENWGVSPRDSRSAPGRVPARTGRAESAIRRWPEAKGRPAEAVEVRRARRRAIGRHRACPSRCRCRCPRLPAARAGAARLAGAAGLDSTGREACPGHPGRDR